MAELFGIGGGFRPFTAGEPKPEVVAALERWLQRAKDGEVVGVAIAALYLDGSVSRSLAGLRTPGLTGELFALTQASSS